MSRSIRPKLPTPTEAEVQRACLELLKERGILAWRSNSRVFKVEGARGRERLMRAGLGKGSSDLVGVLKADGGRWISIEVKREGKKPTADQVRWLRSVNESGGLAFWVDHPRHLATILDAVEAARARGRTLAVTIDDDGDITLDLN